jgi:GH18 family chitinase
MIPFSLYQLNMGIAMFARMQSNIELKRIYSNTKLWLKAPHGQEYEDISWRNMTSIYGDLDAVADYDADTRSAFLYDAFRKRFYGLETKGSLKEKVQRNG